MYDIAAALAVYVNLKSATEILVISMTYWLQNWVLFDSVSEMVGIELVGFEKDRDDVTGELNLLFRSARVVWIVIGVLKGRVFKSDGAQAGDE